VLEKVPIEAELVENSARDDLRRSITESQNILAGQVQAIHTEFERAFASYREIDQVIEEIPVARAYAKATVTAAAASCASISSAACSRRWPLGCAGGRWPTSTPPRRALRRLIGPPCVRLTGRVRSPWCCSTPPTTFRILPGAKVRTALTDLAETLPAYGLLEIRLLDAGCGGRAHGLCQMQSRRRLEPERIHIEPAARQEALDGWVSRAARPGPGDWLRPLPGKVSPIMETVQRIAVDRFTGRAADPVPKQLVLISDMIEHESDYSQYAGDLSYDRFKASRAYRKLRTDLHGADVQIYYIQRNTGKPLNSVDHIRFWADWIRDNNGPPETGEQAAGELVDWRRGTPSSNASPRRPIRPASTPPCSWAWWPWGASISWWRSSPASTSSTSRSCRSPSC